MIVELKKFVKSLCEYYGRNNVSCSTTPKYTYKIESMKKKENGVGEFRLKWI